MGTSSAHKLQSYLSGRWQDGDGVETELTDPVSGAVLATASARGLDLAGALQFARTKGQPALRELTFTVRAKLLGDIADVLTKNRERYEAIAIANSGNTRTDAAIDLDGGIGTLKYYARLGAGLGDATSLLDQGPVRLAKAENFQAIHLLVPRAGVAIHINAFNFPSWGLWEKAAVALLAGVPVLAKPASSTALLAHEMVRDVTNANILPAGALSLLSGGVGNLLDYLDANDLVAFTGSHATAKAIRGHANLVANSVSINIEADSINSAVLGPDAGPGSPAFDAFVREVVREMTVKAGQKCTAIRRAFVPAQHVSAAGEALAAKLAKITVGDPRDETVRMGPVVTRGQQRDVLGGIERLAREAKILSGGKDAPRVDGIDSAKSAFVAPTLLETSDPGAAQAVHDLEVFGPAASLVAYRDADDAFALVRRGGGSLVASLYSGDAAFLARATSELGASHGRILAVDPTIAGAHTGHGIVMPQCNHGGPGRAGNGEELGGLHGLRFYHQRVAVQGSDTLLANLQKQAAKLN
jgi:3,4-dehydroadipyl-CoA semialdehyde dehydrogenase